MARHITASPAQYLFCDTGEAIPYPFTLSCRIKPTTTTSKHTLTYGKYDVAAADVESIYGAGSHVDIYSFDGGTFAHADAVYTVVAGEWLLVVAVCESASKRTIYLNNSTQTATDLTVVTPASLTPKPIATALLMLDGTPYAATVEQFDGDMADIAIWNVALTAADVDALAANRPGAVQPANLKGWWKLGADGSLASSAGTYGPMVAVGTVTVTADPPGFAAVPANYRPNTALTWVQKSTHIWALHPKDPLKADKGGNALELVTGTPPPPSVSTDNTLEFHTSATSGDATYYKTVAPLIWGDNPAVAGNQTPPVVSATSFWIYLYPAAPQQYTCPVGQLSTPPNTAGFYITSARGVRFVAAVNTGSGIILPQNQWTHVCGTNDGTWIRLYINGVKVREFAQGSYGMADLPMTIGFASCAIGNLYGLDGRLRLVAHVQGTTWTDAEILEQYNNPLAYYIPDPTAVPDYYVPNQELSWVNKATHIWALHPSNPLKADKGNMPLQLVTGTNPVPVVEPTDKTMRFSGGAVGFAGSVGSYYQTLGSLIWGDDPAVAGNQTPPVVGAISCWIFIEAPPPVNYAHPLGQTTAGNSILFGTRTDHRVIFAVGSFNTGPILTPGTWVHLCGTHTATLRRLYVNGVKVTEGGNAVSTPMWNDPLSIGAAPRTSGTPHAFTGRIRLVASVSGQVWTDAEILEQYQRPFAYYGPDPTAVPDDYAPNTDLSWVQKATHIWALHPSDPTKADKGGNTLELEAGTPTVLASPENTMEFHGAEYYKTTATITFGDDPLVAGNQTPPVIGSVSLWIYPYDLPAAGYSRRVFGGATDSFRSGQIHFVDPNQSIVVQFTTSFSHPVINAWRHVCLTHNATHRRLFINGVKVAEGTNPTTLVMTDQLYRIGFYAGAGLASLGFNGRLRLVAMVNGVEWTDAEILEMYQRPFAYYAPPLPEPPAQMVNAVGHVLELAAPLVQVVSGPITAQMVGQILEILRHPPAVQSGAIFLNLHGRILEIESNLPGIVSGEVALQLAGQILEIVSPAIKIFQPIVAPGREYCIQPEDNTLTIEADGSINCMSTICLSGCDVPFFTKDPVAVLDYQWDWAAWLGGDEIMNHVMTAEPGLTIEGSAHDLKTVDARISGGTTGATYQVACTIETVGNRTDKRTVVFLIQPK